MAILSTDLLFFAAQYATDEGYGGGLMSSNEVQDGISQNVFPLIGGIDAAAGRLQLRKVYASVMSANTDRLLNAAVHAYSPPTDAQVDVCYFAWGDKRTTRSEAASALAIAPFARGAVTGTMSLVSGSTYTFTNAGSLQVGDRLLLGPFSLAVGQRDAEYIDDAGVTYAVIEAKSGSDVTLTGIVNHTGSALLYWSSLVHNTRAPKACGTLGLLSGVTAGATSLPLDAPPQLRVVPESDPYQTAPIGIVSSGLKKLAGRVPIFRAGDLIVVRNAADTVREIAQVARVDWFNDTLELSSPLLNSYAAGSRVSSLVTLGDLQAQVGTVFSQQTWTRVFSDTIIGNPIGSTYNQSLGTITVSNEGAETERWALVFTTATDFKLIGETLGQIASGAIGTNFSPLNPISSQPYFTIPAAGWGTGWQAGNVLRLNTIGARGPFWAARCISPGAAEATDGAEIEFMGSY